jgi:hypothetical protein
MMKGWRTRLLGVLIGIGGLVQMYQDVIPQKYVGPILLGLGVAVIILRELTDTAPPPVQLPDFLRRERS